MPEGRLPVTEAPMSKPSQKAPLMEVLGARLLPEHEAERAARRAMLVWLRDKVTAKATD
jgi:hypothetical protein